MPPLERPKQTRKPTGFKDIDEAPQDVLYPQLVMRVQKKVAVHFVEIHELDKYSESGTLSTIFSTIAASSWTLYATVWTHVGVLAGSAAFSFFAVAFGIKSWLTSREMRKDTIEIPLGETELRTAFSKIGRR